MTAEEPVTVNVLCVCEEAYCWCPNDTDLTVEEARLAEERAGETGAVWTCPECADGHHVDSSGRRK